MNNIISNFIYFGPVNNFMFSFIPVLVTIVFLIGISGG